MSPKKGKTILVDVPVAEDMVSDALAKKYAAPVYAYMEQVSEGTGRYSFRHADAVAMCLWPSRGLELLGFEIKVGRGDWLRELKDPEKSDAVSRYCQRWWIVTTPDVAKVEEVPELWGLQVLGAGGRLFVKKEAPIRKARKIDRVFMASLIRKFQERVAKAYIPKGSVQARIDEAKKEGKADGEAGSQYIRQQHDALRNAVAKFEKESGVKIDKWDFGDVGEAVRVLQHLGKERIFRNLAEARATLERLLVDIDTKAIDLAETFEEDEWVT